MVKKVLAVPAATAAPQRQRTLPPHDVARLRLARALAREHALRLEAALAALEQTDILAAQSARERATGDVQAAHDAIGDIAHQLAMVLLTLDDE
jgi:hypothetical protein